MNTVLIAKDMLTGLCFSYQINCLNSGVPVGVFRVPLCLYAENCFICLPNIQTGAVAVYSNSDFTIHSLDRHGEVNTLIYYNTAFRIIFAHVPFALLNFSVEVVTEVFLQTQRNFWTFLQFIADNQQVINLWRA